MKNGWTALVLVGIMSLIFFKNLTVTFRVNFNLKLSRYASGPLLRTACPSSLRGKEAVNKLNPGVKKKIGLEITRTELLS